MDSPEVIAESPKVNLEKKLGLIILNAASAELPFIYSLSLSGTLAFLLDDTKTVQLQLSGSVGPGDSSGLTNCDNLSHKHKSTNTESKRGMKSPSSDIRNSIHPKNTKTKRGRPSKKTSILQKTRLPERSSVNADLDCSTDTDNKRITNALPTNGNEAGIKSDVDLLDNAALPKESFHCGFVTSSENDLTENAGSLTKADQETCPHCNEGFNSKRQLRKHVSSAHQDLLRCSYCDQVFGQRDKLEAHIECDHFDATDNREMKVHVCSHESCGMCFLSESELLSHAGEAHSMNCDHCGEEFISKNKLQQHISKFHKKTHECSRCGQKMRNAAALKRHLLRHDSDRPKSACNLCSKTFADKSSLYHHKRGIHGEGNRFSCDECDQSFNFSNSLRLHKLKHKGERPHKCDFCDKSYLTASHLKNHRDAIHSSNKQLECPVCNKTFAYENSLKLHSLLHTANKPFKCSQCPKSFVSKQALCSHESCHITGKTYECDICHKKYKTALLLKSHQRRHTPEGLRYMCDVCGAQFMYKSNLKAHYPVHGDSRDHKCKICGKKFKTIPTLYSHQVVHSNLVPHNCDTCGKSFKTKERLRAHMLRHAGKKPFLCSQCGNSFPDKGGLAKHRKTVHVTKMRFACPQCKKGCNRADNLRVHMKIHRDPALLALPNEMLLMDQTESNSGQNDMGGFYGTLEKPTLDKVTPSVPKLEASIVHSVRSDLSCPPSSSLMMAPSETPTPLSGFVMEATAPYQSASTSQCYNMTTLDPVQLSLPPRPDFQSEPVGAVAIDLPHQNVHLPIDNPTSKQLNKVTFPHYEMVYLQGYPTHGTDGQMMEQPEY